MRKESISFRHAVEKLRERLGIVPDAPTHHTRVGTTHAILVPPPPESPEESASGATAGADPMAALAGGFSATGLYGDGMNLYAYLNNNPINGTDPLGLYEYDPFAELDDVIMGIAAERAAFAQGLVTKAYGLGKQIAVSAGIMAISWVFPPVGVALSAYSGANAILDMQEGGFNFDSMFQLGFSVAGGVAGVNASFVRAGQIARGVRAGYGFARQLFSKFTGKFTKLCAQAGRGAGGAVPKLTPWGWTGAKKYRDAVAKLTKGGEHRTIDGVTPTLDEAIDLLTEAGCRIDRIDPPHTGSPVAGHIDYPHINFSTANGVKGHLGIVAIE